MYRKPKGTFLKGRRVSGHARSPHSSDSTVHTSCLTSTLRHYTPSPASSSHTHTHTTTTNGKNKPDSHKIHPHWTLGGAEKQAQAVVVGLVFEVHGAWVRREAMQRSPAAVMSSQRRGEPISGREGTLALEHLHWSTMKHLEVIEHPKI